MSKGRTPGKLGLSVAPRVLPPHHAGAGARACGAVHVFVRICVPATRVCAESVCAPVPLVRLQVLVCESVQVSVQMLGERAR